MGPHPPDDDRRRRLLDADRAAPRIRGQARRRRRRPQGRPLASSSSSTWPSAGSSSACRCSRSSSTSASRSSVRCSSRCSSPRPPHSVWSRRASCWAAAPRIIAALLAIALRGVVALIVGPDARRTDQLVRAVPRPGAGDRTAGAHPTVQAAHRVRRWSAASASRTVGLWLESLWIDAVYHYPWPASLWPEALAMAVPVAVLIGVCGAMVGMVLTSQQLPRRAISVGIVVLDGARHRRRDGQRAALRGTAARDRHHRADRCAERRRPAHGHRRHPHQSARPGQRGPELGVGARLAGRTGQPARHLRRQAGEARPRPLPLHQADAGVGKVEDAAARARRTDAHRRADLPAGRPGHRRRGGACARRR